MNTSVQEQYNKTEVGLESTKAIAIVTGILIVSVPLFILMVIICFAIAFCRNPQEKKNNKQKYLRLKIHNPFNSVNLSNRQHQHLSSTS